jgi:hypothetical protein
MVCIAMELVEFGTGDRGIKTKLPQAVVQGSNHLQIPDDECKRSDVADTYFSIQLLYLPLLCDTFEFLCLLHGMRSRLSCTRMHYTIYTDVQIYGELVKLQPMPFNLSIFRKKEHPER